MDKNHVFDGISMLLEFEAAANDMVFDQPFKIKKTKARQQKLYISNQFPPSICSF